MSHTTGHASSTRHPGNLAWLLDKIADHDVARDLDFQYRMHVTSKRRDGDTVLCTDEIEALALPSRSRHGAWTPPLVRLRRDGLVELTTAGEETRERLAKAQARKPGAVPTSPARHRPPAAVFQAA